MTLEEYKNSDDIKWKERIIVTCILRSMHSGVLTIPPLPKYTTTPKTTRRTRKPQKKKKKDKKEKQAAKWKKVKKIKKEE
ncbi:hypothetical protein Y032_0189g1205 [Ancylostoma ceylanicum]|uniref:Uncharacterized protein n=1 Tax=Ancylostoma ceylanicum TaxID=53326 RepID=A0A016SQK0_9BILA|nr:hypothetical protein Y032_0189g1205 [Ancylostoma ceylanicum]